MDSSIPFQSGPTTTAEYKAAVAECIREMHQINQQMAGSRAEIERLKAESEVLKRETRAALKALGVEL